MNILALEFPPLSHLLHWKDIATNFNKIAVISLLAMAIIVVIFAIAGGGDPLKAPRGAKNFAETVIEFVQKQIIIPTIGEGGLPWTPFLLTVFSFIFLTNITGIIPTFQMPANARLAAPLFLALIVWVIFIAVGVKHQGLGYFGHLIWPPGVPIAFRPLLGLIELLSTLVIRPASLAIRLFANMMAGHILLFTFSLMTKELLQGAIALKPVAILTIAMLIFLTAFEVLVAFLQAYIFAMLTGVYIASSMEGHGEEHAVQH